MSDRNNITISNSYNNTFINANWNYNYEPIVPTTHIVSYSHGIVSISALNDIENATVCVASYDGNNKITSFMTQGCSLALGANDIIFSSNLSGHIKVFLWNDINSIQPICSAFEANQ